MIMKPAFSYPTITIVFLVLTVAGNAQNNQPDHSSVRTDTLKNITTDSLKKINIATGIAAPAKTDSLKTKKIAKRKNEQKDDFNPYQVYNPGSKPLPYNSYREKQKTIEPGPVGSILKDILNNKSHH